MRNRRITTFIATAAVMAAAGAVAPSAIASINPDGYYAIATQTSRCVDGGSNPIPPDGAPVTVAYCNDKGGIWRLAPVTGQPGYYRVMNRWNGKCLSIAGWSSLPGAGVVEYACGKSPVPSQQHWVLVPVSGVQSKYANPYHLHNVYSGRTLDVPSNTNVVGAQLIQWYFQNTPQQLFDLVWFSQFN